MTGAVLILGASGAVGRGLVAAALAAGHPVLASGRDPARLQQLQAAFPAADLVLVEGSVATEARAQALAAAVRALNRPLAGVLVAIRGTARRSRLLEAAPGALRASLDGDLQPHLFAARALLPLLATAGGGGYVVVGGPATTRPWAGYGTTAIAAAGLQMLVRVLHEESFSDAVRVQMLLVDKPARTADNSPDACPQWPCVQAIGDAAVALLERRDPAATKRAVVPFLAPHAAPAMAPAAQVPGAVSAADGTTPLIASATAQRCLADARAFLGRLLVSPPQEPTS
ncbi:MAG TPA: SDR family NAD(P)-dependent oxidoreductase [Luteimonas sp.]|nr:SDR family NAD(P)-dependent oxidoreductase [Luteimonas sp.]